MGMHTAVTPLGKALWNDVPDREKHALLVFHVGDLHFAMGLRGTLK